MDTDFQKMDYWIFGWVDCWNSHARRFIHSSTNPSIHFYRLPSCSSVVEKLSPFAHAAAARNTAKLIAVDEAE
jgi:hypothetical protein